MFRWVRRALIVIALVLLVGGGILVLTSRPDLQNARDDVNARWRALRPGLEQRYALLAQANAATKAAGGPERDLVSEVERALTAWQTDRTKSVDTQVDDANELEALGRRLTNTVDQSARLQAIPTVVTTATRFDDARMPVAADAFNNAVRHYEDSRGGSLRRPIASVLGFSSITSLDVPTTAPSSA
jgi:hypothetical protein